MADTKIVCVLGMHRSGTSVIARVLNLLGVDLGPEDHLLDAAPYNPKGLWEHRFFVELNDRILADLGGDCVDIPAFRPGWEKGPRLEDFRQRARRLIQEDFAGAATWGWKDPRTCLTLPFWQEILPPMRYVLSLRNPIDVARSLERRDGYSLRRGIYLWLAYTSAALEHTAGLPRCLVFYEDILEDWDRELRRLGLFLGDAERAGRPAVRAAVRDFIDHNLRHHRAPHAPALTGSPEGDNLTPADRATAAAQQVWTRLRRGPLGPTTDWRKEFKEALDLVGSADWSDAYQEWQVRRRDALAEIAALVPAGSTLILVDDDCLGRPTDPSRRCIPFLEKDGEYWGSPPDDQTALRELERLRRSGAHFIIFAWPAFWWLDSYPGLHRHLRSSFPCVLENDRLIAFALRSGVGPCA
jgi:hypothetical protein